MSGSSRVPSESDASVALTSDFDPTLATNLYAASYQCGEQFQGRSKFALLCAGPVSSTYLDRNKDQLSEATMPTQAELTEGGDSVKYLWVGMSPGCSEDFDGVKKVKAMDQPMIPYDKEALRVVVPVTDEPVTQPEFYVLIDGRDNGLCETRRINNSTVFYFSEFMTQATTVASRQSTWNTNVMQAAVITTSSGSLQSQSPLQFAKRPIGGGSLPMPFTLSLANEIQFYTSAYAITKQGWLLDHLAKIVDTADPDLQARMPSSNVNLHRFLDREAAFTMEEAHGLVEEAKVLWPTLVLDAIDVFALGKGLRGSGLSFLPYKHLRAFFALGSKRLTARPNTRNEEDRLPTLVHGILADLSVILAQDSHSTLPDLTPSEWADLFTSLVRITDDLIEYNNRYMAAIKAANGPQAVGESLDIIAATFARRSDVDSCKMWIDQIARYMQASISTKSEEIGKQLEKLVAVLKTLELNTK